MKIEARSPTINIQDIPLGKKDLKKGLVLPRKITTDLAYLCGFLLGDGSLRLRVKKHEYSIKCVGDPQTEKEFYDTVIKKLFKKVFNLDIKPKYHDAGTTYGITIFSKTLFYFFTRKIGIPFGKKCERIFIPTIFRRSDKLLRSFIQGFADADFCLTLKKRYKEYHYYPAIEGGSVSRVIIDEIASYLEKWGFRFSKCKVVQFDKRVNKYEIKYRIDINGHIQLVKWMKTIGFRNPKYLEKFKLWKERNKENGRARTALRLIAGDGLSEG